MMNENQGDLCKKMYLDTAERQKALLDCIRENGLYSLRSACAKVGESYFAARNWALRHKEFSDTMRSLRTENRKKSLTSKRNVKRQTVKDILYNIMVRLESMEKALAGNSSEQADANL